MADPIITPQLLAAAGAGLGALSKPRNPLQGALLGGIAGYTGGTALGLGAPTAASGGGLTMGAGGVTGLGTGSGTALSGATGGLSATGAVNAGTNLYGLGGTTAGLSAVPASTALIDPIAMAQREALIGGNYSLSSAASAPSVANYSLVAPSAVTSPPSTSFAEKIGIAGKNAIENPMQSFTAVNAANSLLQPEQIAQAPVVPVQARGQLRPFDPVALLDPYKPSVIGGQQNQPISLI